MREKAEVKDRVTFTCAPALKVKLNKMAKSYGWPASTMVEKLISSQWRIEALCERLMVGLSGEKRAVGYFHPDDKENPEIYEPDALAMFLVRELKRGPLDGFICDGQLFEKIEKIFGGNE